MRSAAEAPVSHPLRLALTDDEQDYQLWNHDASKRDNDTSSRFLSRLVLNADVQPRSYWQVVDDAQVVSLQVCIVSSTLHVFFFLQKEVIAVKAVVLAVVVAIVLGHISARLTTGWELQDAGRGVRQCVLLLAGVHLLSPLYGSLTRAISDDTVAAAVVWLNLFHLYMHDYFRAPAPQRLSGSLSLAAAVGAAVLLSSRLHSPSKVFAQVVYSLAVHVLAPFFTVRLRSQAPGLFTGLVALTVAGSAAAVYALAPICGVVYVVVHAALVLVCPKVLLALGKFKAQINGPWDEAVPKMPTVVRQGSLRRA